MALERSSCSTSLVHFDSWHVCEVFWVDEVTFEQDFFQFQQGTLEVRIDINAQRHPLFGGVVLTFVIAVVDTHINQLTSTILGQGDAYNLCGVLFKLCNEFIHFRSLPGPLWSEVRPSMGNTLAGLYRLTQVRGARVCAREQLQCVLCCLCP